MLGAGAGDAFIRVDLNELPIVAALDVVGVVVNLRFVAAELVVVVSGNTSVTSYLALFLFCYRRRGESGQRGRYGFYFLLDAQCFSLLTFFMCSLMALRRSGV